MWQKFLGSELNAGFVLRSFCLGAGISLAYNLIHDKSQSIRINNIPDTNITDNRYTTFSHPDHTYYTPTPPGHYLEKCEWDPEKYLKIDVNDSSSKSGNQFKR